MQIDYKLSVGKFCFVVGRGVAGVIRHYNELALSETLENNEDKRLVMGSLVHYKHPAHFVSTHTVCFIQRIHCILLIS